MDHRAWIENVEGWASLYAFDVLSDGSYGEIRLMAYNSQNDFMMHLPPGAPEFYPGIPYRSYFTDLNFESFIYRSASAHEPLYSYVNARGGWIKGMYLPVSEPGTVSAEVFPREPGAEKPGTLYCLYVVHYSPVVESDSMTKHSPEVSEAVINISIRLHETQDFFQSMAAAVSEIKNVCGAEKCSVYTVDKVSQNCCFINEEGQQPAQLRVLAEELGCSPYEVAQKWEEDLALSDCLLLDDLSVIEQRDPAWYKSLCEHKIRNIVLYEVRFNQMLVGFIWAANYDTSKMMQIKETLELTTFVIAAVIANYQLVLRLEEKSSIDGLTRLSSRNVMNERIERLSSGEDKLPQTMGIAYADLNGLKRVNDSEGHDAGDRLLRKAAALLRASFGEHEIYRAGGDEFVMICPGIGSDELKRLSEQLRALADSTEDVSFAIGSCFCEGEYDIASAIQLADEDMYRDKEDYYRRHPEKDRRRNRR